MSSATLDRFELLGRVLLWAAVAVLVLAFIGAVTIGSSSSSSIPFAEDVQREGRGIFVLISIGGGLASAGILSGLGAIVTMMVADRRPASGSTPPAESAAGDPAG